MLAKRIIKRIEKYDARIKKFEGYLKKMRGWRRRDKVLLKRMMKRLSDTDFEMLCIETGYTEVKK